MKVTIELTANQVTAVQLLKLLEIYAVEELCGNAIEFYLRKSYQEKFGRKAAKALLPTFYEKAEDKVALEIEEKIEIDLVVKDLLATI